jgi:hypothetical protein
LALLPEIFILDLANNQIASIPESLGNLGNLEVCFLLRASHALETGQEHMIQYRLSDSMLLLVVVVWWWFGCGLVVIAGVEFGRQPNHSDTRELWQPLEAADTISAR